MEMVSESVIQALLPLQKMNDISTIGTSPSGL